MDLVLEAGGTGIAAPPAGAAGPIPVPVMGERYRALLDVAQKAGCRAHLEFWGASKTLGRLETALDVLAAADHPYATVLPDAYHMYKGGSDFATVKKLTPKTLLVFHLNDYPANPPRETINDSQRVYPGDGIAPTTRAPPRPAGPRLPRNALAGALQRGVPAGGSGGGAAHGASEDAGGGAEATG